MLPSRIDNPFPGLRPFEPSQADVFFGRDEQIEELVDRLQEQRFVAVIGASGSGKSSLVRAGLIPVLKRSQVGFLATDWRVAIMRPGGNPNAELAGALSELFGEPSQTILTTLRSSSAGLARYASQKLNSGESLLLVVDQFEELFRYREQNNNNKRAESATTFVKLLLAAAGHSEHPLPGLENVPVYVVITMRSDFLGRCSQFLGLPKVLNESQYLVPRMTRDEQREAIEGPISMVQGQIATSLVQRLLNELGDNPDQLPVMQHVLMRTWEQSAEEGKKSALEIKAYEDVGGVKEALNRDADHAFAALRGDKESEVIARRIFQRLVEPGAPDEETRRPTPLSELVAVTGKPAAKVKEVIEVFRSRGFLTISRDEDPIIDIGHESLIRNWKLLGDLVSQESRWAATYRRLADTAELYERDEERLLVDPQLQLALDWRKESEPNEAWAQRYHAGFPQAIAFLEKSREARAIETERVERQRRRHLNRVRLTAIVFGVLFIMSLAAFGIALRAQREAARQKNERNRFLYDSNIYAAQRSAEDGQLLQAQKLLDELLAPGLRDLRGFEWFHLWRTVHGDDATLTGHSEPVTAVVFSPNGEAVASGSQDKTVRMWDTKSHREIALFTGHTEPISALSFSPDGKILASSSLDGTVKLWLDPLSGGTPKEITLSGHSGPVRSLVFSPDNKTLATCSDDQTIKLWDVHAVKEIATLSGHTGSVTWLDFSPDGKLLASSGEDQTVKLWDLATRTAKTLVGHTHEVWAVAFSPDGKTLASGSDDGTVKLWSIATGKVLATIDAHVGPVWSVVFSPDGQTFASGSIDRSIKLWNVGSLQRITTLNSPDSVLALAYSPDGKTLASAVNDKSVMLWDATARKGYATLQGHEDGVSVVAFQPPNGETLASGSEDRTVKLWNTASASLHATLAGHSDRVSALAFSPDGKRLASGSGDTTVKLWDTSSGNEIKTLNGHTKPVLAVAFSPDGKLIASGGADGLVKLWDAATLSEIATLNSQTNFVRALAFSPDSAILATGNDKTIKLWRVGSKQVFAELQGHSGDVTALAFSHGGQKLASASLDKTVKVWDTNSRAEIATLTGHSNYVMTVAFSPDDAVLASGGLDRIVRLWDIASQRELMRLTGHIDSVNSVAFAPDGKTLATGSGSDDKTIKLWLGVTERDVDERRSRDSQ